MSKPEIHLICNAHLDPVWQWRWEEGAAEAIATFGNAAALLEEHPHFIFNHNEAVLYQWVKKWTPALFKQIQKLQQEGRWNISGGWFIQPDVNLPGTESILRHIELGKQFFKEYFDAEPATAYNFDSFGHSAGLPQLLVKSGYKFYIHQRPEAEFLKLPDSLYRWKGIDGSVITAYRIEIGLYHTEYENLKERMNQGLELSAKLGRPVAVFWGIGNHGGGATRKDLDIIDKVIADTKDADIIHSTPDRYYTAIQHLESDLPLVEGNLQRVFIGCYTSLSRVKRGAVKSLAQLLQTEKIITIAQWLRNKEFDTSLIRQAWQAHLFNDFHDILPGTCIEPAEKDALNLYGFAEEIMRRLRFEALSSLYSETGNEYLPVLILNTNNSDAPIPVEVECMISHRPKWEGTWHLVLLDSQRKEIVCQEEEPEAKLPFNGWRRKISWNARLPKLGTAVYFIEAVRGQKEQQHCNCAVNYHVSDQTGLVNNLKTNIGSELLFSNLMQPIVAADDADSWGTGRTEFRDITGKFEMVNNSSRIIEDGPIRRIHESRFFYNSSSLYITTTGYSNFPVIEYAITVNWAEPKSRLQFAIPTTLENTSLFTEIIGGLSPQPLDGEEYHQGRWSVISGTIDDQQTAIGICNTGQHSINVKEGEARITALRSAAYCHEQGQDLSQCSSVSYMDMGEHRFRFLILVGDPKTMLRKIGSFADWLNAPPFALAHYPLHRDGGNIDFIDISPSHIGILSVRTVSGNKLHIRLQEQSGIEADAVIKLFSPKTTITVHFKPFELKTLLIDKDGGSKEEKLLYF